MKNNKPQLALSLAPGIPLASNPTTDQPSAAAFHGSPLSPAVVSAIPVQQPPGLLAPFLGPPVITLPNVPSTSRLSPAFVPSQEIGFPSQPMHDSLDVDEEIVCLEEPPLHSQLQAITDNSLFLSMHAQDDVNIGKLTRPASDDHLSLTASRHAAHLVSCSGLIQELMDFGAHLHGLMAELFPRKRGRPPKSIYLQQHTQPVAPSHAMITRSSCSFSFSHHD